MFFRKLFESKVSIYKKAVISENKPFIFSDLNNQCLPISGATERQGLQSALCTTALSIDITWLMPK